MRSRTIIITAIMVTTEAALYRLMTWLSPAYPLGAFSYSHGLEYAVETGLVRDRDTLCAWVAAAVSHGAGRSDGALLSASWHAVVKSNETALDEAVELASAWRGTAETALESKAQGAAFLAATRVAWPHLVLDRLSLRHRGDVVLPVAVGAAAAAHGVPLAPVLTAYFHAFSSNLVSAGMRLIPLGQSDGQRAIAALEGDIARAVEASTATALADTGTAAPILDWCSMRHETQYTRLFRS